MCRIDDAQEAWSGSTGRYPALDNHVDGSDEEQEEFTFPGAETTPTRRTPSPPPQPLKSTLNPAAIQFTFQAVSSHAKTITTAEEVAQVTTISVNGDPHVGNIVATAMEKVTLPRNHAYSRSPL